MAILQFHGGRFIDLQMQIFIHICEKNVYGVCFLDRHWSLMVKMVQCCGTRLLVAMMSLPTSQSELPRETVICFCFVCKEEKGKIQDHRERYMEQQEYKEWCVVCESQKVKK